MTHAALRKAFIYLRATWDKGEKVVLARHAFMYQLPVSTVSPISKFHFSVPNTNPKSRSFSSDQKQALEVNSLLILP